MERRSFLKGLIGVPITLVASKLTIVKAKPIEAKPIEAKPIEFITENVNNQYTVGEYFTLKQGDYVAIDKRDRIVEFNRNHRNDLRTRVGNVLQVTFDK